MGDREYILLPCDSDGKTWHEGDAFETPKGAQRIICGFKSRHGKINMVMDQFGTSYKLKDIKRPNDEMGEIAYLVREVEGYPMQGERNAFHAQAPIHITRDADGRIICEGDIVYSANGVSNPWKVVKVGPRGVYVTDAVMPHEDPTVFKGESLTHREPRTYQRAAELLEKVINESEVDIDPLWTLAYRAVLQYLQNVIDNGEGQNGP